MIPKIELKDISYVYGEGTPFENPALKNVNMKIETGKITGLIGHTGSGKSTLVRLLNGLERATSGQILLDGFDIWEKPKEIGKVRFRVGLVMQYPEYQLFEETVARDIGFGPKNMGLDADEIERRVTECAGLMGLAKSDLEKSPFELSGGQKRRAAIAGILAMHPEVLILDEPAAGLDPEGRNMIFNAIEDYRRKENATVLIVSHSMEDMAVRCDDIIVLSHGETVLSGSKDSVFSDPHKLIDAGLDVPEITRLAMIMVAKGFRFEKPIYTVSDAADDITKYLSMKGGEL